MYLLFFSPGGLSQTSYQRILALRKNAIKDTPEPLEALLTALSIILYNPSAKPRFFILWAK